MEYVAAVLGLDVVFSVAYHICIACKRNTAEVFAERDPDTFICASCIDQFMLGNDFLVAPVSVQGEVERSVMLPDGHWKYVDGKVYEGGKTLVVPAPRDRLPYFERVL